MSARRGSRPPLWIVAALVAWMGTGSVPIDPMMAWSQTADSTAAPSKATPSQQPPAESAPPAESEPAAKNQPTPAPGKATPAAARSTPAAASPRAAAPITAVRTPAAASGVALPPTPMGHEETRAPARAVPPGAKAGVASKMCGVCHSEVRVKYEQGVHRSEGIACTSCHGGDPDAMTVESAHRGNFRGVPSRRTIPALCASCHADVAKMRVYNLPSNQYELYQTSRHGILLAKGDEAVAVCTDCHGVHEIRPRDDPKSSVFGRNIPSTCGKCHGNAAFLARRGKKDNPVLDYAAGVHGKAYLAGNDAAPECTRCHGSHGATPPGAADVDKVCGTCHMKTRGYFLSSVHKEAMAAAGQPECVACHHNHKTQPVSASLFETKCQECHAKGDEALKTAATFRRMIADASAEIQQAEARVASAAKIPIYVEDYRSRLQDARTALLEAAPVTHSLDSTQVEPHTRRARSIAMMVNEELHEKVSGRWWRIVGLALFWFYLLLTARIVWRARRRAASEPDR